MLKNCRRPLRLSYFLLALFYCQSGLSWAKDVQQITILADDSFPPYSYVENNELKGIYVDIVKAAAILLKSHYRVSLEGVPWQRALMSVKEGRVLGVLPPYKHIARRNYIWPYSLAIMSETVVAYCQNEINIIDYFSANSPLPLAPLNVGINSGYMIFSDEIQAAIDKDKMVVWENKSTGANLMKLQSKRIDCYLNDRLAIQYELLRLNKARGLNFDGVSESLIVMSQTAHIGYSDSKNKDFGFKNDFIYRMDAALMEVKASAEYEKIIARYIQP
jgi:polar amino acid transport system substrate-binding protein